jgi:hypothetical protein
MSNRNKYKILPVILLLISCLRDENKTPCRESVEVEGSGSFVQELSNQDMNNNAYTLEGQQSIESPEINPVEHLNENESGFSIEEPRSELCAFVTNLYNNLGSYESDKLWLEKNRSIEALLLLYFKTEESLHINNEKELDFITSLISPDKKIVLYSWNQKIWSLPESFNGIIQYVASTGEPGAVTVDGMNMSDSKYTNINLLKDNVYLLYGEDAGRSAVNVASFVVLEFDEDEGNLTFYRAFNHKAKLLFDITGLWEQYKFSGPHVIDYRYNFDKEPYTITITYIQFINEDLRNTMGYIIATENSITRTIEFVFDGKEFIGDYDILEEIRPQY